MNARIHYVGVPLLHISAMVLLGTHLHVFAPVVCAVVFCAFNFLLDVDAAIICLPYQLVVTAASSFMVSQVAPESGLSICAFTLHVISWIAQIIGHRVYEGNSPAILESLVGSVLTAPMFVVLEVLWSMGYAFRIKTRLLEVPES